jgi:hypothetical protein
MDSEDMVYRLKQVMLDYIPTHFVELASETIRPRGLK